MNRSAVLLTSPAVRKYIINYGRPFIFSTSLSHSTVCALNASFDYIESAAGDEVRLVPHSNKGMILVPDIRAEQLRAALRRISETFAQKLSSALKDAPPHLLALPPRAAHADGLQAQGIVSPIFPVLTSAPLALAAHLRALGYGARPVPYPVVPRGQERVRVIMHARNTEEEADELVVHLLGWARDMVEREQVEAGLALGDPVEDVCTSVGAKTVPSATLSAERVVRVGA